jgi:tetratricopeptide (TPR) repeat protein
VKQGAHKAEEIAERLFNAGKIEFSVRYFRAALRRNVENVHVRNRLGMALRRLGNWNDAVHEYQVALKTDPNDAALYYNIGRAYMEGGLIGPAEDAFLKALELNPGLREAETALGELDGHSYWDVRAYVPENNFFQLPNWLTAPLK